jgi:hypothetical protein
MKKLGLPTVIALGFLTLGFIAIALAWNGAARYDSIQQQFPFAISGGIAGLGFIGIGLSLLLFEAGRRMVANLNTRFDALTEALSGAKPAAVETNGTASKAKATAASNGRVVVGRSSFHRPDCRLVAAKQDSTFASTEEAVALGLQPCRVCEPTAAASR